MNYKSLAEDIFRKSEKINVEFFLFTYGSIVTQLLEDNKEQEDLVNQELFKLGYNIGVRLIDDFLSKTNLKDCKDFQQTAEMIKIGFKIYLNLYPIITNYSQDSKQFSIIFEETPLGDYVDLNFNQDENQRYDKLWYANILCGVIKGALEMVYLMVEVEFVSCTLRGDDVAEIKVKMIKKMNQELPPED